MLKVPAFQYYEDMRVTVYQDDTKWWKFYQLPDYVSVRKDINGNPVALLVKYAFSDQDREEKPDLPRGGGIMNFDVELKVMESDEEELRKRLQKYVDGEWNRLKSLADSRNVPVQSLTLPSWHNRTNGVPRPADDPRTPPALTIDDVKLGLDPDRPEAPPGDEPPEIELSYPEWTKGTFAVLAPTSANLVTHAVVEGPLSLTGPNTAADHDGADRGRRHLHAEDPARGDGRGGDRPAAGRRAHEPLLHVAPSAGHAPGSRRTAARSTRRSNRSTTTTTTTPANPTTSRTTRPSSRWRCRRSSSTSSSTPACSSSRAISSASCASTAMEVVTGMMEKSFFEETEPPAEETDLTTGRDGLLHPQATRESPLRVVLLQRDDQLGRRKRRSIPKARSRRSSPASPRPT